MIQKKKCQKMRVIFMIEVQNTKLKEIWITEKRYDQFQWLDKQLRIKYRSVPKLPPGDPKMFGKVDVKFFSKLREKLVAYLHNITSAQCLQEFQPIRSFLELSTSAQHQPAITKTLKSIGQVRAIVDVTATQLDELSFKADELLTLLERGEEWCKGKLSTGEIGKFKTNCVELVVRERTPSKESTLSVGSHNSNGSGFLSASFDSESEMTLNTYTFDNLSDHSEFDSVAKTLSEIIIQPPLPSPQNAYADIPIIIETAVTSITALPVFPGKEEFEKIKDSHTFRKANAVHAFAGTEDGMLAIKIGDKLIVMEESEGWCWGSNSLDEDGWFPRNFIEYVE